MDAANRRSRPEQSSTDLEDKVIYGIIIGCLLIGYALGDFLAHLL